MKKEILLTGIATVLCLGFVVFLFYGTLSILRPALLQRVTTSSIPAHSSTAEPILPTTVLPGSSAPAASLPGVAIFPIGVTRLGNEKTAFSATTADLILCYNQQWGSQYMRPLDTWRSYTDASTPCCHTGSVRYSFLLDEAVHYWPAIDVYCAGADTRILEISIALSQHDWSQQIDDIFKAQCICILSVFYPSLSKDDITALYAQLRQEAQDNEYIAHSAVPVPRQVSVLGEVGCWGYTYSGMIRINIIPVDAAFAAELSGRGIPIKQIAR